MKKLILAMLSLACCFALAMPAFADVAPGAVLIYPITLLAIIIGVPVAAYFLYRLLRNRKK